MTSTITDPLTDERAVAIRIAHRMSQIGWVEDNDIFKALSQDLLPAVELLVDGQRYLVNVEAVPGAFRMADGAVQEVLF